MRERAIPVGQRRGLRHAHAFGRLAGGAAVEDMGQHFPLAPRQLRHALLRQRCRVPRAGRSMALLHMVPYRCGNQPRHAAQPCQVGLGEVGLGVVAVEADRHPVAVGIQHQQGQALADAVLAVTHAPVLLVRDLLGELVAEPVLGLACGLAGGQPRHVGVLAIETHARIGLGRVGGRVADHAGGGHHLHPAVVAQREHRAVVGRQRGFDGADQPIGEIVRTDRGHQIHRQAVARRHGVPGESCQPHGVSLMS